MHAGSILCIGQVASKRSSVVKYFLYDLTTTAIINCLNCPLHTTYFFLFFMINEVFSLKQNVMIHWWWHNTAQSIFLRAEYDLDVFSCMIHSSINKKYEVSRFFFKDLWHVTMFVDGDDTTQNSRSLWEAQWGGISWHRDWLQMNFYKHWK